MIEFLVFSVIIFFILRSFTYLLFILYALFYPFVNLFKWLIDIPTTFFWSSANAKKEKKETLEYWYFNKARSLRTKTRLKVVLYWLMLFVLFGVFFFISTIVYADHRHQVSNAYFQLFATPNMLFGEFSFYLLILIVLGSYIFRRFQQTRRGLYNKELSVPAFDINKLPVIREVIDTQKRKMGIKEEVILKKALDLSVFPSILKINNTIHLKLPLGFLKIAKQNPQQAEAMLTHELSHIIQQDENYWLLIDFLIPDIQKLVWRWLPFLILLLLPFFLRDVTLFITLFNIHGFDNDILEDAQMMVIGKIILWPSILFILDDYRLSIIKFRRRSEEIADTAGVLFSNGLMLQEVLTKYGVLEEDTSVRSVLEELSNRHPLIANLAKLRERVLRFFRFLFLPKDIELQHEKEYELYKFKHHPPISERIQSIQQKLDILKMSKKVFTP